MDYFLVQKPHKDLLKNPRFPPDLAGIRRKELMPGSYGMTWVLRPRGGHRRPVGYPDPYQNSGLAM